jgi:cytochrome d ubiquinol oxidase subunit II
MSLEFLIAGAIFASLVFYALTGGADFGAGIWNIFLSGKHAKEQADLVQEAIQPIWEADHVWLILLVTVLFTAFPPVFSFICIALNIPLFIALLGIILRGSAFVFRKHDEESLAVQSRWSIIFSIGSVITPLAYGMALGAISSGQMQSMPVQSELAYLQPCLSPYGLSLGFFILTVFSMEAATYLAVDADGNDALQNEFRKRALINEAVLVIVGLLVLLVAWKTNVWLWQVAVNRKEQAILTGLAFFASSIFLTSSLLLKRFKLARVLVAVQTICIVAGFAVTQYPYLIPPHFSIYNSAAPAVVLQLLLYALIAGALTLFPSLFLLYRIFKGPGKLSTTGTESE